MDGLVFGSCSNLTSITLPKDLHTMGDIVFLNCTSLDTFTFLGDAPTVGTNIFGNVASSAKVYVLPDAIGFGETFEGLPVETFSPPPSLDVINHENDNLHIHLSGDTSTITIEGTTDLTADNWITNHNPTVTNGTFQFSTTNSHRYYSFSF